MGSFAEERRLMTVESAISNQGPHQKPDTPVNAVSGAWSCQHTRQGISPTQIHDTLSTWNSQETRKSAIEAKVPQMKSFPFSTNITPNAKSKLGKKSKPMGEVKDVTLHFRGLSYTVCQGV